MRRAAPGVQVSQGRLRVDAARAIKKLREYQLVDRAAWVLEGIRAAVAAGATKITLRGDANDIWLGWHGKPWDAELLPRLFDELVSPEVTDDNQHVRLLAGAVNSALGMDPAHVDVYSIMGTGAAHRVRYTPDVLAEPENELGEAPLRHVAVEQHEPPTDIMSGMLVHLRRRASLQLLSYWIGEPPELPLARGACRDVAVPLEIDGDVDGTLHRDTHKDLVRVPLEEGLSGFVAITRNLIEPGQCFEVAERGVVLARQALQPLGFDATIPVPIRVFLDAERLPTNASRSQVRPDVHPITTAERRAKQLIGPAIEQLIALYGDGTGPLAKDARKAAFQLLAASVAGHPVGWQQLPPSLVPLGKLPLVRNCFGKPRPVDTPWVRYIHTEKQPLDADLDPWIEELLWAPKNDDVQILLGGYVVDVSAMRRQARWARQQRKEHKKFLAHKKREIKVQTSVFPRARVSLGVMVERSCVPQATFEGIRGEICIYTDTHNAGLALCVDGRELERVELASPIAFDAVVDSKLLIPGERYRGARRDHGYAKVVVAIQAGVVRAVETLVAEPGSTIEADMPLIRSALTLARDLGFILGGPLAQAPVFHSVAGGYLSHAQLNREKCIGVIADAETIKPPAGRVIIHANGPARDELRKMFGARMVSYHKAVQAKEASLERIANELRSGRGAVAIMRDDYASGVIALADKPTLYINHAGVTLGDRAYNHVVVKSSVAVLSDAVVPNEKWTGVTDDAGLGQRSFREWEVSLLRLIAARLIGDPAPQLVSPTDVVVGDHNFHALMDVLLVHDIELILGEQLAERLRQYPMFRRLGVPDLASAQQVAADAPSAVYYIEHDNGLRIDGYTPVIASIKFAQLLGKLVRRTVHDGETELKRRQKLSLRKHRLDELLARPERPAAVTETPSVAFTGNVVRGFVGLTNGLPEVRIHTENRPFKTVTLTLGYPLVAAVNLALTQCGDTLEGPTNLTLEEIADDVRDAVPALLAEIATTEPRMLGAPGPARRLLAAYLAVKTPPDNLRNALRSAKAFATVQGEVRSIAEVENPLLRVAALGEEWLPPGDGEGATVHDEPILRVSRPADELDAIVAKLHDKPIGDVTGEVTRLQARRRMARGLLPTPKLSAVPDQLKRPLKDFPEVARRIGHGEVGFSPTSTAMLMIHEQGQLQRTHEIDVMPAIHLAVEEPHEVLDHAQMTRLAQDLAIELVRVALPSDPPVEIRRNLARAVLGRRVPPVVVGAAPLFEVVGAGWLDWAGFQRQLDRFHDVWAVTTPPDNMLPLDPERLVIYLDAADIELGEKNGYQIINAKLELELDAKTRENKARRAPYGLALPSTEGVLASVELDGNGLTGPRGMVAVLSPQAVHRRGVYPHRAMHPFDRVDDVCRWPTLAVVDDARITPDRTWSAPKGDETWAAVTKAIRAASELALEQLGEAPGEALAEIRITNHVCSDVKELRDAPRSLVRGLLWLSAVPFTPVRGGVVFRHAAGTRTFVPEHGIAMGGSLAIYTEPGDQLDVGQALEQLCGICHGKLVRMLLKDTELDRDIVAAHVAHAIALNTVKPTEVKGIDFGCFVPEPLEPRQLATLFRGIDDVPTVKAGVTDIAETAFVDDGSELAKVVRVHLGDRLTTYAPPPKTKPAPPPPPMKPPVSVERPAPIPVVSPPKPPPPPPPEKKAPPPKPHVLQPLMDALIARVSKLGIQTFGWEIDAGSSTILSYAQSRFLLGGRNELLRRIVTELQTESILAGPAIDALAAHAVTLLNIDRLEVTDATEMHALGVLLATPPSASPPRSRRSS